MAIASSRSTKTYDSCIQISCALSASTYTPRPCRFACPPSCAHCSTLSAHACAHAACPCICSCVMPNACFHADAPAITNNYVYVSHRHLLRIICWPFVITYYLLVISHYLSILSYLANASEVGGWVRPGNLNGSRVRDPVAGALEFD